MSQQDDIKPEERTILVSRLPLQLQLQSTRKTLRETMLDAYGNEKVEKLKFVNRGTCMASYTNSCSIQMKNQTDVDEHLGQGTHLINGYAVEVEPFRGYNYHKDMLCKGIYKMQIKKIKIEDDVKVYNRIGDFFHEFGATSIELRKDKDTEVASCAWVRFKTKEGRERARQKIREEDMGWEISFIKGKKEKAAEAAEAAERMVAPGLSMNMRSMT